ncbi:hypothetical protein D3C71_2218850 [compost metagenome]
MAARATNVIISPTPPEIIQLIVFTLAFTLSGFSFGRCRKHSRNRITDTVSTIICVKARSGARKSTNSSVTM